MSWLGGSLSSLTGQLSNLTKDILTEGTEEVNDHVTELRVAQERLKELDTVCVTQKVENDRLKLLVREWEEKAESSELQINSISREYRTLLEEKEREIKTLKQQQHEHQELKSTFLRSDSQEPATIGFTNDGFESIGLTGDEHDFGDNISMQHDINRLRGNLQKLQTECQHWKKLAEQNSTNNGNQDQGSNEVLLQQLKDLQQQVDYEKDQRQFEISSLQDAHTHKISTIRKKHKEDMAELKQKMHELEWSTENWDTQESSDSSTLKLQIDSLKDELTALKVDRDEHLQTIAKLNETIEENKSDISVKHAHNLHLDNQLKVAREKIDGLLLDHDQADTLEVLSDLRQIRLHMDTSAIDRRHRLLVEKDMIVNDIIASGQKGKDLAADIEELEFDREQMKNDADKMLTDLGDKDHQKLTEDIVDSLEKENLLLKKRNVSLQEQVALLEKAVQNATREKSPRQQTEQDDTGTSADETDGTSETTSLTSDLSQLSRRNFELDEQVDLLRDQINKYETEIDQFELMQSDWQTEKEALEQVLMQLRSQMREKENTLNVAEAKKGLLAVEKHEINSSTLPDLLDDRNRVDEIAEDIIELDKKVELLADANAKLEQERDLHLLEKEQLERELINLRMGRQEITGDTVTDPTTTNLNSLLKEKEVELQLIMTEKEDLENDLKSVPDLKLQLEEKHKEVESLLQSHSETHEKKSEEIILLEKEVEELKKKVRGKNEEIVNLSLEKEDMMSSLEELDNQHQEEMAHILKIKEQFSKDNEELKVKLKGNDSEIQGLRSENEALRSQQMVHQTDESANSNELNHQIAELNENNQLLQQQLEGHVKQLSQLQKDLDSNVNESTELKSKLVSSAEALNDLHMEKQELSDKVKKLKDEKGELSKKLKLAREKESELMKQKSSNDEDSNNKNAEYIDILQKENGELTEKCTELSDTIDTLKDEINKLTSKERSKEIDLDQIQSAICDKEKDVEKLKKELLVKDSALHDLENEVSSVKTDRVKLSEECKRKHEECESFSRQLHALEHELHASKSTVTEQEAENNILTTQVERLNNELTIFRQNTSQLSEEFESMTKEMKRVKNLLEESTDRLHTKSEQCNTLSADVEAFKSKISEIEEQKDNHFNAELLSATGELVLLKEELANKSDELDNIYKDMYAKEEEILSLQSKFEHCRLEKDEIERKINEDKICIEKELSEKYSSELKNLESERDAFHSQYDTLKTELEISDAKFLDLKAKYDNLQTSRSHDQGQHEGHSENLHFEMQIETLNQQLKMSKDEIDSVVEKFESVKKQVKEKDNEITILQAELREVKDESQTVSDNLKQTEAGTLELATLRDTVSKLQQENVILENEVKVSRTDTEKTISQSKSEKDVLNAKIQELEAAIRTMKSEEQIRLNDNSILLNEREKLQEHVQKLEGEVERYKHTLISFEADLSELQQENTNLLLSLKQVNEKVSSQESIIEMSRHKTIQKDNEISNLQRKLNHAKSFMNEDQLRSEDSESESQTNSVKDVSNDNTELIEVEETVQPVKTVSGLHMERFPSFDEKDTDKKDIVIEIEKLQDQLKEKDKVIFEMQRNNSSLLKMLDSRSKTLPGETSVVDLHKMENDMRSMKVEKEQMMDILNEKSRENSNLKAEVQRLINVISAEKTALEKLQKDNQELVRSSPERDGQRLDDMQKEVVQNLSRMIRDKDLEVESLTQKNQTLLSVLQESSTEGSEIKSLLQDKDNLTKQLATLQGEREQMITYLNQKHQESLAYHSEVQRLTAFVATETENNQKLKLEYEGLVPQFEEKKHMLLKYQNELINYKQKYTELEVKYGQLIQQSDSGESVDKALYDSKVKEIETLQSRIDELVDNIKEKENKMQVLHQTYSDLEQNFRTVDNEKAGYKKQVDNFVFQLHGIQSESADLKSEIAQVQQQKQTVILECQSLTEMNKKMNIQLQDSEFEVKSLQEKILSLTSIIQKENGDKVKVDQLSQENEVTQNRIRQLQQERDQTAMALQQTQQHNLQLQQEVQTLKEKEVKLNRELDRLRQHLIQIEDGYTREALTAEEREKDLRTRLTEAEEKVFTSSSTMESTSQQVGQKMDSLTQQLEFISQQRDQAYHQISVLQEQNQTYSVSLANLQMVLEQFQQEKDRMVFDETEKYIKEIKHLKSQVKTLEENLNYTKEQLEEASDGLEAASRLSEQLDRKEEAIDALKEEVQIRESSLKVAEDELKSLKSRNDDRVDKLVIKNLFLGYFTAPVNNRHEVLRAIGGVLMFSGDDFSKIESVNSGGWMSGLLKFGGNTAPTPPNTPTRRSTIGTTVSRGSSTFSEMFVRFLERESSPPPPTVRLPAEEMVRDVQKQKETQKPTYNPFTAPRHVAAPSQTSTASVPSSDHILMRSSVPASYSLTTFAAPSDSSSTPPGSGRNTPATTSGAILKDVLNR